MNHPARITVACIVALTLTACAADTDFQQRDEARQRLEQVLEQRQAIYGLKATADETGVMEHRDEAHYPTPMEAQWQIDQLEEVSRQLEQLLDIGPLWQRAEVARIMADDDIEWAVLRAALASRAWRQVIEQDPQRLALMVHMSRHHGAIQDAEIDARKPRAIPPPNIDELRERRRAVDEDAQDELAGQIRALEVQIEQLQQQRAEALEAAERARERRFAVEGREAWEADVEEVDAFKEAGLAEVDLDALGSRRDDLRAELERMRNAYRSYTEMIEGEISEVNIPTERRVTGLAEPDEPIDPEQGLAEAAEILQRHLRQMESVFDADVQAPFQAVDRRLEHAAERLETARSAITANRELHLACGLDRLRVLVMRAQFMEERFATTRQFADVLRSAAYWAAEFDLPEADDLAARHEHAADLLRDNYAAARQAFDEAEAALGALDEVSADTPAGAFVRGYRDLLDTLAERLTEDDMQV